MRELQGIQRLQRPLQTLKQGSQPKLKISSHIGIPCISHNLPEVSMFSPHIKELEIPLRVIFIPHQTHHSRLVVRKVPHLMILNMAHPLHRHPFRAKHYPINAAPNSPVRPCKAIRVSEGGVHQSKAMASVIYVFNLIRTNRGTMHPFRYITNTV